MAKVLIITGILPVSAIEYKKSENDILLVTEDEIKLRHQNFSFKYIFIFPYANKILSRISLKWKSYYKLKKQETFELKGRNLFLFPVFLLPKKVFFRNILTRLSVFLHRKRIEKLVNDFKPTVIHAQDADTGAYIARVLSKKYDIPYVVTLRSLNRISDDKVKKNLIHAKFLIGISSRQIAEARKIINKDVTFIPHGIGNHFFNEVEKKVSTPLKLITVSRLLKLKNIDLVIKSLSTYEGDFIFDIYGEGPEKEDLSLLIEKMKLDEKVKIKGFIPNEDLPNIFQDYHLFVMPSFPETLGRVYFEAMASGLPVVATKNTGIDGLIIDGKEGFLLNPTNEIDFTQSFHDILFNFIENPLSYDIMSRNAKSFSEKFSWNNIVSKYIKLYKNGLK